MNLNEISKKALDMFKSHKRHILAAVILLVFVIRGCSTTTTTQTVSAANYTVVSGSLENSLKVLGTTQITNLQTLVFGTEGKVTKIYVKEGDKVKAGDLLAELDKKQLSISLSQQGLSIQNAKINYDKFINQYTDADKLKAFNDVNSAQTKLDIAKKELSNMALDQGKNIQTQGNLAQTNIIFSKTIVPAGKDILHDVYEILYGFSSDQKNYISLRSPSNWSSAQINYSQSNSYYDQFTTVLSSLESTTTTTIQSIQDLQNKSTQLLNSLSSTLDSLVAAINDSLAGVDLSQATLDDTALNPLKTNSSKVLSLRSTLNANISSLQNSDNSIQSKKSEISTDEAQLLMYKQTLQDMENGPNSNDRTLQSNSIKQSQLSYQQTSQQLDNYQIIAPFDGTIDAVGFKVGDTVSSNAGTSANGITLSNPDIYEVSMLIDQIDIVKIDKGQNAEISFDAYPGYTVTGVISTIDPTPVTNAGVVSYYANIAMNKGDKKIYDGMSVTVNIIIEKKTNVLVVPSTAIQTLKGVTIIPVVVGGDIVPKPVEVGITDGSNSEILSGISLGDIVSLTPYSVTSTSSSVSSSTSTSSDMKSSMGSMRALEGGSAGGPPN